MLLARPVHSSHTTPSVERQQIKYDFCPGENISRSVLTLLLGLLTRVCDQCFFMARSDSYNYHRICPGVADISMVENKLMNLSLFLVYSI